MKTHTGETGIKVNRNAFTLVELLVVLLIIGILTSVFVPVLTNKVTDAKYTQALADISKLESALAAYELDNQAYPPSGNAYLTLLLLHGPTGTVATAPRQWHGPYLQVKEDRIAKGSTVFFDQLLDPWGNPYYYVVYSDYSTMGTQRPDYPVSTPEQFYSMKTYQIFSKGKNGLTYSFPTSGSEADDVNSWYGDERQRN